MKSRSSIISIKIQLSILFLFILFLCCKKDDNKQLDNWQVVYADTTVWMSHFRVLNETTCFIIAGTTQLTNSLRGRQFVLKTTDTGKTWIKYACKFPTNSDAAREIAPLNSNSLIALGNHLFKSTDNGLNWFNMNPDYVGSGFFDIYIKDSLNWILAEGNSIARTVDGGKSLERVLSTEFPAPFDKFAFPSSTIGYACGGSADDYSSMGFIAKTTDGGQNWSLLNPEPWNSSQRPFPDVYSIQFLNEQIGYIFTFDGKLYKTIDGANNWTLIYDKHNNANTSFYFISEHVGYYSEQYQIYNTTNGGRSWQIDWTIPLSSQNQDLLDMVFVKSGEGFVNTPQLIVIKK